MNYEQVIAMKVDPKEIKDSLNTIIGSDSFVEGSTNYETVEEAKAGYINSINNMAVIYGQGTYNIPNNPFKAFQLFELAAKYHHPAAVFNLAGCYKSGEGIEKNLEKAKQLYQQALDLDPRPEKKARIEAKITEIDKELAERPMNYEEAGTGQEAEAPRKQSNSSHESAASSTTHTFAVAAETSKSSLLSSAEAIPFASTHSKQPSEVVPDEQFLG
ncbi:MAG: hypothetical protein K0S29_895 [Gammaproteobacteria bacterium]|jgi:hypothetical protein|nr:hypothetical protein [Gammaproteobacteria bacterium]